MQTHKKKINLDYSDIQIKLCFPIILGLLDGTVMHLELVLFISETNNFLHVIPYIEESYKLRWYINPFVLNTPFLYALKTSENLKVF